MADNQRIVLLNRLITRSISHAPREHKPPMIPGVELFSIIEKRQKRGFAVEFLGADDDKDDTKRLKKGAGHDCFRLSQFKTENDTGSRFVTMLFEFIDDSQTSFPLVDLETFAGRELSGKELERGASCAHVVVKLPSDGDFDDGNYRCAFENVSPITRMAVERFLSRQIRRDGEWEFSVTSVDKKSKRPTTWAQLAPRSNSLPDSSRPANAKVHQRKTGLRVINEFKSIVTNREPVSFSILNWLSRKQSCPAPFLRQRVSSLSSSAP